MVIEEQRRRLDEIEDGSKLFVEALLDIKEKIFSEEKCP